MIPPSAQTHCVSDQLEHVTDQLEHTDYLHLFDYLYPLNLAKDKVKNHHNVFIGDYVVLNYSTGLLFQLLIAELKSYGFIVCDDRDFIGINYPWHRCSVKRQMAFD